MLNDKGFDLWADGYDREVGLSDDGNTYPFAGYKEVLGRIFAAVMERPGAAVLDIGFGTGTLTTKLYERGCAVYGQDFSSRMMLIASEKMPEARLFQGDFTKGLVKELRCRKYDFIVATYSLHHLTNKEKGRFLRGLKDLLRDGGKILIGDVAFMTRADMEKCRRDVGDEWDDEEYYFVIDEMERDFPELAYQPVSFCSGIITLQG